MPLSRLSVEADPPEFAAPGGAHDHASSPHLHHSFTIRIAPEVAGNGAAHLRRPSAQVPLVSPSGADSAAPAAADGKDDGKHHPWEKITEDQLRFGCMSEAEKNVWVADLQAAIQRCEPSFSHSCSQDCSCVGQHVGPDEEHAVAAERSEAALGLGTLG